MDVNWEKIASNLLKTELTRRGMTYQQLQEKLNVWGITDSANAINTKINRGSFSFTFFLQCALALEIKLLRLEDILEYQIK